MKVEVKWTSTTCLDTEMICKMPGCLHIMNGNHPSSVQNLEMAQFSGYRGGSQVMLKLESHGPQMIAKELMVLHLQKWCQQTCYTLDVEPLGNTGMNCISTGSADCHTQGCRIASQVWRRWHLYLEDVAEMDHTTRELCQCWISTGFGLGRQLSSPAHPGKTDTELFRLQGLSQFHCFAPIIVIQKYARQKSCCDFAVPNNSFDFNIHIFVWRRIRFLQILSEAASGHTHTHTLKPNFWFYRVVLVFPPLKCGHPVLHHLTMTCRRRIQEWFDGFPARRMRHDGEGGGGFWSPEQNPVKRFFSDEPPQKKVNWR